MLQKIYTAHIIDDTKHILPGSFLGTGIFEDGDLGSFESSNLSSHASPVEFVYFFSRLARSILISSVVLKGVKNWYMKCSGNIYIYTNKLFFFIQHLKKFKQKKK